MDSLRGLTLVSSLGVGFTLGNMVYDYYMQQFDSAVVAISCIIASRKCGKIQPIWNSKLEELTSHKWPQIDGCYSMLYKY